MVKENYPKRKRIIDRFNFIDSLWKTPSTHVMDEWERSKEETAKRQKQANELMRAREHRKSSLK